MSRDYARRSSDAASIASLPWADRWQQGKLLTTKPSGQGQVYLARDCNDLTDEFPFVLKVQKKGKRDSMRRRRMATEYGVLRKCDHPSIVKVHDSNAEDAYTGSDQLYIVMDRIRGETLGDHIAKSVLSLDVALEMTHAVLDAIEHYHGIDGIIHRDIKPDNVILRNGNPRDPVLIDFGIAFDPDDDEHGLETGKGEGMGNKFIIMPELQPGTQRRSLITDLTQCLGLFFFVLTKEWPRVIWDGKHKSHQRGDAPSLLAHVAGNRFHRLREVFDVGFIDLCIVIGASDHK